jgi:hypothetical protein
MTQKEDMLTKRIPLFGKNFIKKVNDIFFIYMEKNSKFKFYSLLDWTSLYLDDCPEIGAFTYRMRGFKNYTPIHYFKNYQIKFVNLFISL